MGKYLNLLKQQHSRFKCFECEMEPTIEILWAEGMAHAWYCDFHFKEIEKKNKDKNDEFYDEISSVRKIYGEASKHWKDGPPRRNEIQKQNLLGGSIGSIDGDVGTYKSKTSNVFSIDDKRKYKSLEELQEIIKQDGGDGGGESSASYMDSSNSNIFTPTFGGNGKKYKSLEELLKQHTIPETVIDRPKVARTVWGHQDRSKLVRRMVRVRKPDGSSYFSTRWVKPFKPKVETDKKENGKPLFERTKEDKEDKKYDGGIITLIPPEHIKDMLFQEDGIKKDDMHITLIYLPFPWETSIVELLKVTEIPSFVGRLTGEIERFDSDEENMDAVVATLIIPGIDEWRDKFIPVLKEKGVKLEEKYLTFKPHITLKYIPEESPLPIETIKSEIFSFDRLEVWEEEKRTVIVDFTKGKKVEKDRGFVHQHDNFSEHPISVKYHQEYFAEYNNKPFEKIIPTPLQQILLDNISEESKKSGLHFSYDTAIGLKTLAKRLNMNFNSKEFSNFIADAVRRKEIKTLPSSIGNNNIDIILPSGLKIRAAQAQLPNINDVVQKNELSNNSLLVNEEEIINADDSIEKLAYDIKTMSLDDRIKWWKNYKPQLLKKNNKEFVDQLILQLREKDNG